MRASMKWRRLLSRARSPFRVFFLLDSVAAWNLSTSIRQWLYEDGRSLDAKAYQVTSAFFSARRLRARSLTVSRPTSNRRGQRNYGL